MRRHVIAILAILCLLGAVTSWLWQPVSAYAQYGEKCWWLGTILIVLWLAYPDVQRMPSWLLLTVPLAVVVVLHRPRWLWAVIPALIVVAILKPRNVPKGRS